MVADRDAGAAPDGSPSSCEPFTADGFFGEINRDLVELDVFLSQLPHLIDPASATETIHWGRNYLYATRLRPLPLDPDGDIEVVVKQFRNQGLRRRLDRRWRGSKAERSWEVAWALRAAGIATPEPVALVESADSEGASFYIARRLVGTFQVRHFFRRLSNAPRAGEFPPVDPHHLLAELGRLARRLHDAGILFRDLSIGNVLARPDDSGSLHLFLVDINRARLGQRLGTFRRSRDICRFPIVECQQRLAFLRGYWGEEPAPHSPRWWLYTASVRGYLLKHAVKNRLRGQEGQRRINPGGTHHAHIPAAAAGASARDRIVWDRLSDQPHQHTRGLGKLLVRLADAGGHLRDYTIVATSLPRVWRRYRQLQESLHRQPVPFAGIGLGLRPWPQQLDDQLAAVRELGVRSLLLRLHPWEEQHDDELQLAARLAEAGCQLIFALPQNRDLVRDQARWQAAVEELAERFVPYGRTFQVGQAVNRSKWGIWTRDEYLTLFQQAAGILRRHPGVEVIGPAVIDFEHQVTMALVNRPGGRGEGAEGAAGPCGGRAGNRPGGRGEGAEGAAGPCGGRAGNRRIAGLYFDAVSSLLYVDRRGAPENRQLGFDTIDKVLLLRAIAETGRNCGDRCLITEVNWPLWEGPHSPAGRKVSVDEESQADFLVRYYLLALGTGLVEKVFWWRLLARGYGLMTIGGNGELRRRPSFFALKTLIDELDSALFLGPLPAPPGAFLYHFRRGDYEVVAAWSVTTGLGGELPRPAASLVDRDGNSVSPPDGTTIELTTGPRYYRLR